MGSFQAVQRESFNSQFINTSFPPQEEKAQLTTSGKTRIGAVVNHIFHSMSHVWHRATSCKTSHREMPQEIDPVEEAPTANQELFDNIFRQLEPEIAPDPQYPPMIVDNAKAYYRRHEQLMLNPSDRVVKQAAEKILGKAQAIDTVDEKVIDEKTWEDLDLFSGKSGSLLKAINRTETELGGMYLMGLLGCPTADVPTLQKRQELIQKLLETGLFKELRELLHSVKMGEKQLLSTWDKKVGYPASVLKALVKSPACLAETVNSSSSFLTFNSFVQKLDKLSKKVFQVAAAVLFPLYVMSLINPEMKAELKTYKDFWETMKFCINKAKGNKFLSLLSLLPFEQLKIPLTLSSVAITVPTLPNEISFFVADFALDAVVQEKFYYIASYYKTIKNMYTKLLSHPEITQNLTHFEKLTTFFENKNLTPIFTALESKTFNEKAKFFFNRGRTIFLLNQFNQADVREQFGLALTAIGEIDAFLGVAHLVDEFKNKKVQYCFPEYLEGEQPELHIENFWSTLVDPNKVVTNSMDFDPTSPVRCDLITGPNGAGKTTVLRSIVSSLVIGQSLGIAPASIAFTPFTRIISSMNPRDLPGKLSLLQKQITDLVSIQKEIDSLPPHTFAFVVLDELLNGTSYFPAISLAAAKLEELVKTKNVLSMVVTQERALSRLETRRNPFETRERREAKNRPFKNYQVLLDKDGNPLFKIKEGTSLEYNAFKEAEEFGFSKETVAYAKKLYQSSQSDVKIEELE